MEGVFLDITLMLTLAVALGIVFRALRQPEILAYMLAGIIIGPLGLFRLHEPEAMHAFSEIGITLLLFILGLELKLSELRSVGKVALITGIGQIVFTSLIGFGICLLLGISPIASVYLSVALTFSSTIVIVKLLSDKKDLNALYGKVAIGFLLVQDFVAIIALIILAGFASGEGAALPEPSTFLWLLGKAALLFAVMVYLSQKIIPRLIHKLSHSRELLFLFAIAWAFGISAVVSAPWMGLSIEIGGFLAGLALANSTESFQIVSKVRSLRDFFITLFFVLLGTNLVFESMGTILLPAVLLSAFVLVGNPLIVMIIMGAMGFRKRTSFMAGLTVAQISEFSLIVTFMGLRIGHISPELVSLVTLVAMITFTLSTYAIINSNQLYDWLKPWLRFFEKKSLRDEFNHDSQEMTNHIVLVGVNRMGRRILNRLKKEKTPVLAVDFDPGVVDQLRQENIPVVFGDFADPDIREKAQLDKARLLISTLPDMADNLIVIHSVQNLDLQVIVAATQEQDIRELYDAGAHYVVMAYGMVGEMVGDMVADDKLHLLKSAEDHRSETEPKLKPNP